MKKNKITLSSNPNKPLASSILKLIKHSSMDYPFDPLQLSFALIFE